MRANDAISGLVLIILAVAMISFTAHFPAFIGQKYGPSLFPRILAAGLAICGLLLVMNGLAARRRGARWVDIAPWVYQPWRLGSFMLTLVMLVLYIVAAETVGFIPIALIFLLAMFLWLGVRPTSAIATAVVATFAIQYFFASLLRVPLPRGWLTNVL